jgi:hypothetical protein
LPISPPLQQAVGTSGARFRNWHEVTLEQQLVNVAREKLKPKVPETGAQLIITAGK